MTQAMTETIDKKFKRVILHVGPDKTGSTAIQNALFQNRSFLLSKGIMYSSGFMVNDKFLRMHFLNKKHLKEILSGNNQLDEDIRKKSNRYINHLREEINETACKELILSHEGLFHLDVSELESLREFLNGYTKTIEIVFYVRDPVAYAKSAMSQRVKTGRRAWGMNPPYIRYKHYLTNLMNVFGKEQVKPRLYSRKVFPDGNIVRDFLSLLPLSEFEQLKIVENTKFDGNPSLPHKGLYVGDRVVELLDRQVPSSNKFKEMFVPELITIGEDKIRLSKHQLQELVTLCSEHIRFLHEQFAMKLAVTCSESHQSSIEALSDRELNDHARLLIERLMPEVAVKKRCFSFSFMGKWLLPVLVTLRKIRDKAFH